LIDTETNTAETCGVCLDLTKSPNGILVGARR
jgi:hypothetical protein